MKKHSINDFFLQVNVIDLCLICRVFKVHHWHIETLALAQMCVNWIWFDMEMMSCVD